MTLKELIRRILDEVVFPPIREHFADTPNKIDDALWAIFEKDVLDRLEDAVLSDGSSGGTPTLLLAPFDGPTIMASSWQSLVLQFLQTNIYPILDAWTKKLPIPFNLDDLAWAAIKAKIADLLSKVNAMREAGGGWSLTVDGKVVG